jgi:hypothetical protein
VGGPGSTPGTGLPGNINPATPPTYSNGVLSGGYGYLATISGAGAQPRSGQVVARFTF